MLRRKNYALINEGISDQKYDRRTQQRNIKQQSDDTQHVLAKEETHSEQEIENQEDRCLKSNDEEFNSEKDQCSTADGESENGESQSGCPCIKCGKLFWYCDTNGKPRSTLPQE